MLIEIKEIENCRLNIKFEADNKQVEDKRSEVLQYFKAAKVPGFRPGKATPEAIRHHFKYKIDEAVKEEMARHAFTTVIAEKNIRPFGQPQFLAINLDGSRFTCDFCVNKIPDIELKTYKGFDLPKPGTPNAIEMAEKIIEELRNRNGDTLPFEENDFIQIGDNAIMNFSGFVEGSKEPIFKKEGEMFHVGKAAIPAFNENLLGMKVGETREFDTVLPNDFAQVDMAGKTCHFVVTLSMASKSTPSPLNDELAHKVGTKDINDLMSMTQGIAGKRVQELEKKHLSEQIANRLIEAHEFEVPDWLSGFEARLLAKQYGNNWDDLPDDHKTNFIKFAIRNVKLSIILDKIRESEPDAQLSDEEALNLVKVNIEKYKEMASGSQSKSDEEVLNNIANSGYLSALMTTVRDDFTIDFIMKNSNIIE